MLRDLLSAIRGLCRRPFRSLLTIGILAVGLSSGLAVAAYVNGFYQPFPGADPKGLMRLSGVEREGPYREISYLDYLDYAEDQRSFKGLAATQPFYAASVRREEMTEVAFLEAVSGSYFSVLEVTMSLGRGIAPADDRPDVEAAAVLSHAWWQRSFGGDPNVIGRTVYLNYRPFVVVGVAGPEFLGTSSSFRPQVWIPFAPFRDRYLNWHRMAEDRDTPLVRVFGRLGPGVSREQAAAELSSLADGLNQVYPRRIRPREIRMEAATWIEPRSRAAEGPTLRLMVVAAVVLLLLVCANVANLLLSLASGRLRETSIRAALGASPGRLFRQALAEIGVMAFLAGCIALATAVPLSSWLGSYFARPSVWGANVPRETSLDSRVVLLALTAAVLTALLTGLLPALRASRWNLMSNLRSNAAGPETVPVTSWAGRVFRSHDLLITAQVALTAVLLVVAGLVLHTLYLVARLEPGFQFHPLVVTHISTSSTDLKPEERERFFREVAEGLSRESWVRSATVADYPLLSPHPTADLRLEGLTDTRPLLYSKVIPGFFEALGIQVVGGRAFDARDRAGSAQVAMINQQLARRFFAGRPALGRRIWWPAADGNPERVFEIVGIVADTRTSSFLTEPEPTVYFSYPQHAYPTGSALIVSANIDPHAAVPYLNRWLRSYEPHLAIVNVVTYQDVVQGFLYAHRMNAELFSVLALLGLTLATVGVFSVTSLAVTRRTREIGIRMSMGAQRWEIGRLVITRALAPVVIGLTIGLAGALSLTEWVGSLLYEIQPTDPWALAAGSGILVIAALAASYIPALRAATVDPVTVLRSE